MDPGRKVAVIQVRGRDRDLVQAGRSNNHPRPAQAAIQARVQVQALVNKGKASRDPGRSTEGTRRRPASTNNNLAVVGAAAL